ncbi:uncharacterized protein LOC110839964 [Zootermopsis nevadensis]|uniref:uncharacterized protein LOC110839964 n=1 Tax=Zootermopsis nevadensis TaxID=136037 RepID=UPI000B8E3DFA|nr:uncharacterized protein LOC110839964 [Zootermopsis nevadensis]
MNASDSTQSHNGGEMNDFFNSRQQSVNNEVGSHSGNSDCVSSRTSDDFIMKEENNLDYNLSDSLGAGLPEQLSRPMSESTSVSSIPRNLTPHLPGSSPAQACIAPVAHVKEESSLYCGSDKKCVSVPDTRLREPVVRLNRLSAEDQALMQRSLRAFAEKSPTLACKLGITSNHKISRNANEHLQTIDSESESEGEPKNKSKYFKAREKERELQRQKGLSR